jgi:hypothetical protein
MPNSRFVAPFSESQLKAAAIVPKVAAFPSILGSLFIIQHVLRSKKRRGRVYHRILLLMSVNDLVYSFKAFISTWPQPRDTPDWLSYGSVGNAATCTAAGFLGHGSALTSIVYNLSLTIFFLMVVRYGWKESQIKKRVEFWLHFVPFLVGWSTATAGLFLKLFNAFGWTCWINSYPLGCTDNVDCERGDNAGIYRWVCQREGTTFYSRTRTYLTFPSLFSCHSNRLPVFPSPGGHFSMPNFGRVMHSYYYQWF